MKEYSQVVFHLIAMLMSTFTLIEGYQERKLALLVTRRGISNALQILA